MGDGPVRRDAADLIAAMSLMRGQEWVDGVYALADAWDGTEDPEDLMQEYGMDYPEASDTIGALRAIHALAEEDRS